MNKPPRTARITARLLQAMAGTRQRLRPLRAATHLSRRLALLLCILLYAIGAQQAQAGPRTHPAMAPATVRLPRRFTPTRPAAPHAVQAGHADAPAWQRAAATPPPLPPLPAPALHPPVRHRGPVPAIVPLLHAAGSPSLTIPVQAGWNLIALPLAPTSTINASTVLATLLNTTHGT